MGATSNTIWVRAAWATLTILLAAAVYGFLREQLFSQQVWSAAGLMRLLWFSAVFWTIAVVILWIRPRWLLPALGAIAFFYSEWWCWKFFSPLAPVAVLYFLGSCYFLGRWMFRRAGAIVATLAGLAMWIFVIFIAVHFAVNRPAVYAAAFAIPYVRAHPRRLNWPDGSPGLAVLLYVLALHWILTLKPEVSYDALAVHLAVPEMIAEQSRFGFDFHHYAWGLMPLGGDLAFTAVYLMGGEIAARLMNFALLAMMAGLVYKAARRWLEPGGSALAAALFASTPVVQLVTGSLFVENVWAAFVCGGVMALSESEFVAAAMLMGAAFSTKLLAGAFVAPAAAIALAMLFRRERRIQIAAAATLVLIVFAAPPYLQAWAKTKNPIFPYSNDVFRSPDFDTAKGALEDARFQQPARWDSLYRLTFRSPSYVEGQKGAAGLQYFLLIVPLLLAMRRKGPWIAVAVGIAGAAIVLALEPNLRYLYAALPLLAIGIAWLMAEMPGLIVLVTALVAVNAWFLPASGWYHKDFGVFTRAQLDDYLRMSAPERRLVEVLNRVAPGQPIAALGVAPVAGLHAKAYLDTWRTYRFWRGLGSAPDAGRIAQMFRELGIHYVITAMPPASERAVVDQFIETWTAPSLDAYGKCQIRVLLDTPLERLGASAAGPSSYDDLDPRLEYLGAWLHDRQFEQASGQSITYSDQPGDRLRFFFRGTSVTYVYTMARNRGIAEVKIDGVERKKIDLYSARTLWQQQTVFDGLEAGAHRIELTVMEEKDPKSSGRYVDLDRFVVGK